MKKKLTVTIDKEMWDWINERENASSFVNEILHEAYARMQADMLQYFDRQIANLQSQKQHWIEEQKLKTELEEKQRLAKDQWLKDMESNVVEWMKKTSWRPNENRVALNQFHLDMGLNFSAEEQLLIIDLIVKYRKPLWEDHPSPW